MIVRFKPLSFFEDCYRDHTGDYWPSEEVFREWIDNGSLDESFNKWVSDEEIGRVIKIPNNKSGQFANWAYEVLTKEKNPEEFL